MSFDTLYEAGLLGMVLFFIVSAGFIHLISALRGKLY
jgi:hypothetical protein